MLGGFSVAGVCTGFYQRISVVNKGEQLLADSGSGEGGKGQKQSMLWQVIAIEWRFMPSR